MKKKLTLIILLTILIGNAQCPAPSNLILSIPYATAAQLNWTENGTATAWEIAVIPDYYIGSPMPTFGTIYSGTDPYIINGLPPTYGCYAFFVRSVCSTTDVSPWVAVGSLGCSSDVYNYLATLSTDTHNLESNVIQVYPNPSKNVVQIKSNSKIEKITIFDSLGKVILIQTENNNEIDIENLSKGIYIIEVYTENEKNYRKLIKE
ncbi:T9SS type A sorting domain-containing protein [Flavobacterium sp.]|uniref:T9SS type A sorting domain-containing protein n=1 Tax=Flavobacterium sp. TaxID=239 RepID=UPI0037516002